MYECERQSQREIKRVRECLKVQRKISLGKRSKKNGNESGSCTDIHCLEKMKETNSVFFSTLKYNQFFLVIYVLTLFQLLYSHFYILDPFSFLCVFSLRVQSPIEQNCTYSYFASHFMQCAVEGRGGNVTFTAKF